MPFETFVIYLFNRFKIVLCLFTVLFYMDMHRFMVITIEQETISKEYKDSRHNKLYLSKNDNIPRIIAFLVCVSLMHSRGKPMVNVRPAEVREATAALLPSA